MIDQKIPLPRHVGIIMDGNGRWATKRGLSRSMGHKAGAKTLKKLCKHLLKLEIPYLSVFAFSTENFKRDKEEVDYLMNLFITMFQIEFSFLKDEQVRVVFSGRREPLPVDVLKTMDQIMEETKDNKRATLNVCLNYGGQSELVDATKKVVQLVQEGNLKIDELNENNFAQNPNLSDNLAFSLQLQLKAKAYFPELVRHIYLRAYRYNLHFKPRSLLVEVGAQNNTVEEAINACDPLAHILDMVLKGE